LTFLEVFSRHWATSNRFAAARSALLPTGGGLEHRFLPGQGARAVPLQASLRYQRHASDLFRPPKSNPCASQAGLSKPTFLSLAPDATDAE